MARRHADDVALRRAPRVVELRRGHDDEVQDQHRQDHVEEEAVEERGLGRPLPHAAVHGCAAVRDIAGLLVVVELLSSSSAPHANAAPVDQASLADRNGRWISF